MRAAIKTRDRISYIPYESWSSSRSTDEQQGVVIANWVKFSCDNVVLKCRFITYLKALEGETPFIMV